MNSFTGSGSQRAPSSSSSSAVSFDSYQFDFGIGSGSSSSARSIKDQKLNPNAASSTPLFSSPKPAAPSWTPSPATRPSWTHQPATAARSGLPNPSPSMAGDIFGRSWSSTTSSSSKLGIQDKNPSLFSDLVGSAIGQGRSPQNVPLKSAPPKNSSFSMADLKSSKPKTNNPSPNLTGSFSSSINSDPAIGSSMKSATGATSNAKLDPFGSLMGFASKPSSNVPLSAGKSSGSGGAKGSFGAFRNAPTSQKLQQNNDSFFGGFHNAKSTDFGKPQPAADGTDPLNMFFSPLASTTTPVGASSKTQPIPEFHDWDVGSEFGGHDSVGTTTELEGLPPPPAGVTASAAKTKGLDNYKQGQFADAIKWLSWAFVLFEKSGNIASSSEVLTCRASCYKEVGEYKKAIADCSKVLDHDSTNVSVLLQRALLYESSEKYRLGAEDLRAVLKIDPGNRLARSTIHRMNQFAD